MIWLLLLLIVSSFAVGILTTVFVMGNIDECKSANDCNVPLCISIVIFTALATVVTFILKNGGPG